MGSPGFYRPPGKPIYPLCTSLGLILRLMNSSYRSDDLIHGKSEYVLTNYSAFSIFSYRISGGLLSEEFCGTKRKIRAVAARFTEGPAIGCVGIFCTYFIIVKNALVARLKFDIFYSDRNNPKRENFS